MLEGAFMLLSVCGGVFKEVSPAPVDLRPVTTRAIRCLAKEAMSYNKVLKRSDGFLALLGINFGDLVQLSLYV